MDGMGLVLSDTIKIFNPLQEKLILALPWTVLIFSQKTH